MAYLIIAPPPFFLLQLPSSHWWSRSALAPWQVASSEALFLRAESARAAYLDGVLIYNRFLFFQFLKHLWLHWSKISQSNECTVKSYIIQILQTLIGSLDISVTWQTAADWMTCLPNFQNTFKAFVQHSTIVSSFCAWMSHFLACTAAWTSLSKPPPRRPQAKIRANLTTISLSLPPVDGAWHLIQAIAVVLQEFHVVRQEV